MNSNFERARETLLRLLETNPNNVRKTIRNTLNKNKNRKNRIKTLKVIHSIGNNAKAALTDAEKTLLNKILEIERLSDRFTEITGENFRESRKTNKFHNTRFLKNLKKMEVRNMLARKFPNVKDSLKDDIATAEGTIKQLKDAIRIAEEDRNTA